MMMLRNPLLSLATACSVFTFFTSDCLGQPLDLDTLLPPESVTSRGLSMREAGLLLLTLCWEDSQLLDQCQRNKSLLRHLLYQVLYSTTDSLSQRRDRIDGEKTERRREELPSAASKRGRGGPSGFYSEW
ncbi:uncharacterized protein LOC101847635 [Aplysia californica]|uniref:Uncharacterized protein LOC101847635 n=1 Tax=Aplysia californica TaxID=6500 RepID=A0ABM1AF73_APLCA|nr:uncharacterized protein LOC101847635 [Aplysia californica]XP_035829617.1 uncharacterized protein LOC101847635 [Aplysia californica]